MDLFCYGKKYFITIQAHMNQVTPFRTAKCGMVKSILYIVLLHESECDMAKYFMVTNEFCVRSSRNKPLIINYILKI